VDIDLLRAWKSRCVEFHKVCSEISRSHQLNKVRPRWLIDTWKQCIVPSQDASHYVALSYVWGKQEYFKTQSKNLALLQEPFSFSPTNRPAIPRTVRDAMGLTKYLGERYLWVDSLCIPQDDEKLIDTELNNMAYIFYNASLTIVAAQGTDSDYGLHRLQGISKSRSFTQQILAYDENIQPLCRQQPSRRTEKEA